MEQNAKLDLWIEQSKSCHWWFPYNGIVLASERHNVVSKDERGRLHSVSGPACGYSDGWGVWAIHGVRVPRYIIQEPTTITVEQIESEKNVEVRRIMMDRFGPSRFLQESGAKEIHRDDFGVLMCKEVAGDEPVMMVKVVNGTSEPDGSFKDYWIRVPPQIRRAKEAVAWTFAQPEAEYQPDCQT